MMNNMRCAVFIAFYVCTWASAQERMPLTDVAVYYLNVMAKSDTVKVSSCDRDILPRSDRDLIVKGMAETGKALLWSEDTVESIRLYLFYEKGLHELYGTDTVLVVGKFYCPVFRVADSLYSEDSCYR